MAKECLSAAKEALREQEKATQDETGTTFVTLSEAVAALEAFGMDQKVLGGNLQHEYMDMSNAVRQSI